MAKAGGEGQVVLELWSRHRLMRELHVPKALHGGLVNDGWFSRGPAWGPDESKVRVRVRGSGECTQFDGRLRCCGNSPCAPLKAY